MKVLQLTQGKYTLLDDEDYSWAIQWRWWVQFSRNTWYAVRNIDNNEEKRKVWLHREILKRAGKNIDGLTVDHINNKGWDNQRKNLRPASGRQNVLNKTKDTHYRGRQTSSKYKGVGFHSRDQVWEANICIKGRRIYLGRFENEKDAARAYNKGAEKYHGQYANMNNV